MEPGQQISADEMAAMRQAAANPPAQVVEEPVVTPEPVAAEPVVPAVADDNNATPPVAPVVPAAAPEQVAEKPKSFEELLAERTKGKFNKWEDVEPIINAPKDEFVDDEVRHWNELKKKGVKLDKQFFELQNLDVEGLKDPKAILIQTMKLKGENLSDRALNVQLEKKYGISAWIDKEDHELTDEDAANKEIFVRDAKNELEWLRNFKKERTFVPEQDPEAVIAAKAKQDAWQANWEKFVDGELAPKATSLSVIVDPETKDSFEYKVSEADRKEVSDIMKLLPRDINAIFSRFIEPGENGTPQINHAKVQRMLLRDRAFDQAVANAKKDGIAEGAKKEIETLKNTNFTPASSVVVAAAEPESEEEARAAALRKQGRVY